MDPVSADFERKLRTMVTQIAARVNAKIPLTASGERFRRDVGAQLAAVERTLRAKIPTDPVLAADFRRNLIRQVEDESRRVRARIAIGVDIDRNRITRSLSGLTGLLGRFGSAASDVTSRALGPLNSALSSVSQAFGAGTSSISGVLLLLLKMSTLAPLVAAGIAVLGGSAIAAFGAITAGVVGLPVVLASLIAPIAAIALGMDGIKRAAEPLKDEFQSLKDQVNIAFELGMRPVFEKLQALFPTLSVGLAEVARGVTRVASDFTGILTTPAGIESVRIALAGVSDVIDRARPGLSALFQEFLNIAGTRELYDILGDTIGGVAQRFADLMYNLRASGALEVALAGLKDVLFSVTDLLFELAEGATHFFASAAPGLSEFFDSLTRTLGRVDWGSLGESFGGMMERLGAAIERIPPETWRGLADAVGGLVETFLSWAESGGIENLIKGLTYLGNILGWVSGIVLWAHGMFIGYIDFLGGIPGAISGVAGSISGAFSGVSDSVSSALGDLPVTVETTLVQVTESADRNLGGLPEKVGGWFETIKTTITDGWGQSTEGTSSSLESLGIAIDNFFATLPERLGYWFGFITTYMTLKSAEAVTAVGEWFAQLPERIGLFAADMVMRIQGWFERLPGLLGGLALMAVMAVVGFFQTLPDRVGVFAAMMVMRLEQFFSSLPGKLWSLAESAVATVVDVFRGLPARVAEWAKKTIDDVLRFFKELPGKLLQAGKDAIQGFIDGIQEKAASLVQAAKDAVGGALRGARDAIAAHSPSLKFRDLGRDTIQGYIIGLREKLAPLLATVRAVFARVSGEVSGALGGKTDVLLGSVSDAVWDRLLTMGYRGDPTDRREALVNVPLSALQAAKNATAAAAGSGTAQAVDLPTLLEGLARVLNAAELTATRDGITLMVNDGNRVLARR